MGCDEVAGEGEGCDVALVEFVVVEVWDWTAIPRWFGELAVEEAFLLLLEGQVEQVLAVAVHLALHVVHYLLCHATLPLNHHFILHPHCRPSPAHLPLRV